MNNKNFLIAGVLLLGTATVALSIYTSIQGLSCHKDSCINLDAKNQKCEADAKTIIEEKFPERKIELRYSAKCDAAWTRAIVPPGSILYVEDVQGKKYGYNYVVPDDDISGPHYGNMGHGRKLKACVQLLGSDHFCTKLAS
jgi:hypothetical protein